MLKCIVFVLGAIIVSTHAFKKYAIDTDPYGVDFFRDVPLSLQPSAKFFNKWSGTNTGSGSGTIGTIPNGSWWDRIREKFPFLGNLFGQRMVMARPYWYYVPSPNYNNYLPNPNYRPVYAEPMTPSTQDVGSVITVGDPAVDPNYTPSPGYYYPKPENPLELPGAVQFKVKNNGR